MPHEQSSVNATELLHRVLVVDDQATQRLLVAAALAQAGFEVVECESGEQALELLAVEPVTAVLLDVMMPGIDGFETCARIRATAKLERLPVMMMTGTDDDAAVSRAFEVGASDFIAKPIKQSLLNHRLRYMLRAHERAAELWRSREQLFTAETTAGLGSWEWDPVHRRVVSSRGLENLLAVDPVLDVDGLLSTLERLAPHQRKAYRHAVAEARRGRTVEPLELSIEDGRGHRVWLEARVAAGVNPLSGNEIVSGTLQDITEHKRSQEKIRRLAFYDPLTELPNAAYLRERLDHLISLNLRQPGHLAVLYVNLDRFKDVNDFAGRDVGDAVLQAVAKRIAGCLRKSDIVSRRIDDAEEEPGPANDDSCVARLAGDEFIAVMNDVRSPEASCRAAQRILNEMSRPIHVLDNTFHVSCSIGIAELEKDVSDGELLLQHASAANHEAKKRGGNSFQMYRAELTERIRAKLSLEHDLRGAIRAGELEVYYQPRVDALRHRVAGAEALVRWHHPEKGFVSPGWFIPVAEETDLIIELGEWVLREAARQFAVWRRAGLDIDLSFNVSARQFRDREVDATIARVVRDAGLEARHVIVELTEGVLMDEAGSGLDMLDSLKAAGFRIAIDDFGTGYSSLSYLKRLPIDSLKIDRSFVMELPDNRDSAAIVKAIVALAKNLGLEIVAEGVEEPAQLDFLRAWGCDELQGFYFARPMQAADFEAWVREFERGAGEPATAAALSGSAG